MIEQVPLQNIERDDMSFIVTLERRKRSQFMFVSFGGWSLVKGKRTSKASLIFEKDSMSSSESMVFQQIITGYWFNGTGPII